MKLRFKDAQGFASRTTHRSTEPYCVTLHQARLILYFKNVHFKDGPPAFEGRSPIHQFCFSISTLLRSSFRTPHSAFCIPHSAFRIICIAKRQALIYASEAYSSKVILSYLSFSCLLGFELLLSSKVRIPSYPHFTRRLAL